MKFLAAPLVLFVAIASAAKADGSGTRRRRLDKHKIMQHAVRVNSKGERLLDQNFELTSAYSLQFNKCLSLTTEPLSEDIFNDDLISYTSKGAIVAQKSYILFNVCETRYCDYYADDDYLYMVDVETYMGAISGFYEERQETYCEACMNAEGYCGQYQYEQNEAYYQDANEDENDQNDDDQGADDDQGEEQEADEYQYADADQENNGDRALNQYQSNFEVIDCDTCNELRCFANNNQYQGDQGDNNQYQYVDIEAEDIVSWIEGIAGCQQTNAMLDYNYPLYAGFMCNQDGSGVEIALFLDEDCITYTSKASFQQAASEDDQLYMYEAASLVQFPFFHRINCNDELQFLSPDDYEYQAQNYNYNENNANAYQEAGQASEYCQALFEGGATSLRDCNAQDNEENQYNYQNYDYWNEYEQAQNDQYNNRNWGNGQQAQEVTQYYSDDYYWYSYILSYENSMDNSATCQIIKNMQGEYEYIYRWEGSGQLYNYGTGPTEKTTSADNIVDFFSDYDKMTAVLIAAIVLGATISLVAFLCILYSCCCASSLPNKYERHRKELDAKRERLVDERTGNLA